MRCEAHLGRNLGPRLVRALRAAHPVQTVLGHRDRDGGQLGYLVALGRDRVQALVLGERARARGAAHGPVVDHFVHLLERKQLPVLALVPGLTARPATGLWLLRTGRG